MINTINNRPLSYEEEYRKFRITSFLESMTPTTVTSGGYTISIPTDFLPMGILFESNQQSTDFTIDISKLNETYEFLDEINFYKPRQ